LDRRVTISKRRFAILLAVLVIIRLLMVAGFLAHIPPATTYDGGKVGKTTGDEWWYYELANSLRDFSPAPSPYTIGFALWMIPFIVLFNTNEVYQVVQPMMLAHAALLFPLAIILVGLIGTEVFTCEDAGNNRRLGLLLAALFTAVPYLFYALFRDFGPYYGTVSRGVYQFVSIFWADITSDPLSTFLLILAFYLLLREFKEPRRPRLISLGLILGLAMMVRPTNAIAVALFGLALLGKRRFKDAVLFGGAALFAFVPQLIYDYIFYGSPLKIGFYGYYPSSWSPPPPGTRFSPLNVWHFLVMLNQHFPFWFLLLPPALIGLFSGLAYFWRRDKVVAALLFLWPMVHVLFYGTYKSGLRNVRYLLPTVPLFLILGIGSAVVLGQFFLRRNPFSRRKQVSTAGSE
jgi:hypothetical protein